MMAFNTISNKRPIHDDASLYIMPSLDNKQPVFRLSLFRITPKPCHCVSHNCERYVYSKDHIKAGFAPLMYFLVRYSLNSHCSQHTPFNFVSAVGDATSVFFTGHAPVGQRTQSAFVFISASVCVIILVYTTRLTTVRCRLDCLDKMQMKSLFFQIVSL